MNRLDLAIQDLQLRLTSEGFMRAIAIAVGFCVGLAWWLLFYFIGHLLWPAGGQMPGTLVGFLYLYVLMYGGAFGLAYFVFQRFYTKLYARFVAPSPQSDEETQDTADE